MKCPKCGSGNVYQQDGEHACMMCGKRWPLEGANPIIITKAFKERDVMVEVIKKYPCGKIGVCVNCRREVWIADKEGLCGSCHASVDGAIIGTPEYAAYLQEAKERLNKKSRRGRKPKETKPISPEKIGGVKTHVKALGIKHNGGDPSMAHVLATLQIERLSLLDKVDKIKQAIDLLS